MRISTTLESLDYALDILSPVLSDKLLPAELKNIVFCVSSTGVQLVTTNFKVTCFAPLSASVLEANIDETMGYDMLQVAVKDLSAVVGTLHGLHATKIVGLEFDLTETDCTLQVEEQLTSEEATSLITRYKLTPSRLKQSVVGEILQSTVKSTEDMETLQSEAVLVYLNTLLPTLDSSDRDYPATRINVGDDFIYTVPNQYAALMHNRIGGSFINFVLQASASNFVKAFLSKADTVYFDRVDKTDIVELRFVSDKASALVKALPISKAYNVTNFTSLPESGIAVNRLYMTDVLKRLNLTDDLVNVKIDLDEKVFSCATRKVTAPIPVLKSRGTGVYEFSLKPALLTSLMFNHTQFSDYLFLFVEKDTKGQIILGVRDDTRLWHTKIKGLTHKKGGEMPW